MITSLSETTATRPHIVIDGVSFSYARGAAPILEDVSLSLAQGEFFVLLGPSGCGKTTIMNQLAGFEKPSTGSISVDGETVRRPGPDRAVVFQGDDSLLGWLTVRKNIEFGLRMIGVNGAEREQRVDKALALVELSKQAKKYPHELSGGMKQRVQIARALVTEAPCLLMDEPFGALDSQTRSTLQDELAAIWSQRKPTVLFITHDITEALILGDRIGVMTSGPRAHLHEVMANTLPRPRTRGSDEFAAFYRRLEAAVTEAKTRAGRTDG